MPPKKFIPARKRSAAQYRREALTRLKEQWEGEGEFDPTGEPTVTPSFEAVEGGVPRILEALRAHDNADARAFIGLYESLTKRDRSLLTLEEVAYAAGIGSLRLAEVATSAAILHGQMGAKLLIASSMQKVARSIVKAATDEVPITADIGDRRIVVGHTNGDTKAMELFGKISGMVPIPKGNTFNFGSKNEDRERDAIEAEPEYLDAGERLRLIHDAVEPKRLPSPPSTPIDIGGRLAHMQDDVAEVLAGE